jgi:L-cysteine:1D-myo-inositol 2-amino-2-deoxy-alpha-D-glucopyranoside ligase
VVEQLREALANDLNAPEALAVVDAWCEAEGDDAGAPALVAEAVDALLGITLR